jgi:omega-6 fatty acid desaturase (delta-12 desaturase)
LQQTAGVSPSAWPGRLAPYRTADDRRAIFELAVTGGLFVALWLAMLAALQVSIWLVLLLAIPAAGLMVRLFMIQHDCGHGALFSSRARNDAVGRALGVLTLTPYDMWKSFHAAHHAGSGNLDRRGIGDIDTITVAEYRARGPLRRLAYRLYRHPAVMFGIGPSYMFLFKQRLPFGAMNERMAWISTQGTNVAAVALAAVMIYAVGLPAFLAVHLPIVVIAASIGVWLFYVQHQFENTYWEREPDWSHPEAALHGSSFYDLPAPLMWMTGNIGLHHVHHLSSRIPFHRLPKVVADYPELGQISRITFLESLKCVRLTLWDEQRRKLVSFREAAATP